MGLKELKVGQVLSYSYMRFTISEIYRPLHIRVIHSGGGSNTIGWESLKKIIRHKDFNVIAEYKTWQEAVNSKEFNRQ